MTLDSSLWAAGLAVVWAIGLVTCCVVGYLPYRTGRMRYEVDGSHWLIAWVVAGLLFPLTFCVALVLLAIDLWSAASAADRAARKTGRRWFSFWNAAIVAVHSTSVLELPL